MLFLLLPCASPLGLLLVPTHKQIKQTRPIAMRFLPATTVHHRPPPPPPPLDLNPPTPPRRLRQTIGFSRKLAHSQTQQTRVSRVCGTACTLRSRSRFGRPIENPPIRTTPLSYSPTAPDPNGKSLPPTTSSLNKNNYNYEQKKKLKKQTISLCSLPVTRPLLFIPM